MKVNAAQAAARVQSPGDDIRLYLFYGSDEAGGIDLADRLFRALGEGAERVDLEPSAIKSRPGMLADEAASASLFGERRLIRVASSSGEEVVEAATMLLAAERAGNPVVVLAPNARKTSRIVKLAEAAPGAVSAALYPPEGAAATQLASQIAREQGLRLTRDAAEAIVTAARSDRMVMAREIDKIATFLDAAPDRPREADMETVALLGASIEEGEFGRAIDALVAGDPVVLAAELRMLLGGGGGSIVPVLRMIGKQIVTIAEMRAEIDRGGSMQQVTARMYQAKRSALERALRRWNSAQLSRALERIRDAERAVMASGNAGAVVGEQALITLARAVSRLR